MLIPLICKQCGGKLEVEDTKVLVSGDSFIVLNNQQFECPHCGTKYVSDDRNTSATVSGGGIAIGNLSFGGDIKGDFVIGSSVIHHNSSTSPQKSKAAIDNNSSPNPQKPIRKWWEFWK